SESGIDAFVRTWKESTFSPTRFYSTMPEQQGLCPSLLYYLIVGVTIAAIGLFWNMVLPGMASASAEMALSPLVQFLLSPLLQVIALFAGAGIMHLMVLMLMPQHGPYGRTLRVYCFSNSPGLVFMLIPYVGILITAVWTLVLLIIGLREAHRSTTGRAATAVLLPGCVLLVIIVVIVVALLAIGLSLPGMPT
ncbi:MAG: YIP1 family protein, partial [Longimicrobiales bacterium]